ncbi:hypothetical protein PILCRDRAFT_767907, partial [Piloderma croceum F 1598]
EATGSSKKCVADETLYPWLTAEAISGTTLSDSLELTRKLIVNYTTDLKQAKWSLLSSKFVPDFPNDEWNNVLSGKSVNLDAVFSSSLSTATDNCTVESFREFEHLFGAAKPSKMIATHGDWVTTWGITSRAVMFAFPHREWELDPYHDYITGYFAAIHNNFHSKVLELDKSIRKYVGSIQDTELSDFNKFRYLETRHLHVGGKAILKSEWRSSDPCCNLNRNTCNLQASQCRYRHVCQICKGNHRKGDCPHKEGHT